MGCEICLYQTKTISEDVSTATVLQERHELLDWRSWELGELLAQVTEAPNGYTTTCDPTPVLEVIREYMDTSEDVDDDKKQIFKDCIKTLEEIIKEDKDTVSVNIWY